MLHDDCVSPCIKGAPVIVLMPVVLLRRYTDTHLHISTRVSRSLHEDAKIACHSAVTMRLTHKYDHRGWWDRLLSHLSPAG